jgi:hypothetical protein
MADAFFNVDIPGFFTEAADELVALSTGNWVAWLLMAAVATALLFCTAAPLVTTVYRRRTPQRFDSSVHGRYMRLLRPGS